MYNSSNTNNNCQQVLHNYLCSSKDTSILLNIKHDTTIYRSLATGTITPNDLIMANQVVSFRDRYKLKRTKLELESKLELETELREKKTSVRILYIILAHKWTDRVIRLINKLYERHHIYYVHVDVAVEKEWEKMQRILQEYYEDYENVYIESVFSNNWGGISLVYL